MQAGPRPGGPDSICPKGPHSGHILGAGSLLAHQGLSHHLGSGRTSLGKSRAPPVRPARSGRVGVGLAVAPSGPRGGRRGRGGCQAGPPAGLSRWPSAGPRCLSTPHFWVFHAFLRTQLCPPIRCPSNPHWLQPGCVTLRPRDTQSNVPVPVNAAGLGGRTPDPSAPCLARGGTCSAGLRGASPPSPPIRRPRSLRPKPLPAKSL